MSTKEFAGKLVREIVAIKSYSLWKDNQFRRLLDFPKIGNKHQDRVFNDLQVTALLYVLLFLEERANKKNTLSVIYTNTGEYLVGAFLGLMLTADVSDRQVGLWEKLIKLREAEYRVFALSLGTLRHIRGTQKASSQDPLLKVLRRWLADIEAELVQTIKDTDLKELKVLN